jgi:hypothetical protein
MMSKRLFFHESIEFVTAEGAVLMYRAGEFYNIAEEHVAHFLAKQVAKTEQTLELEAQAAAAEAEIDKAKADELSKPAEVPVAAEAAAG